MVIHDEGGRRINKYEDNIISILRFVLEMQDKARQATYKEILAETYPIMIFSDASKSPLSVSELKASSPFITDVFRIERINEECLTLSLLKLNDIFGNQVNSFTNSYQFIKTSCLTQIPLSKICAIQLINPKLVNRKIIVSEPKL